MKRFRAFASAALLAAGGGFLPIVATPAMAETIDASDPSRFVTTLTGEAFTVLRTGSRASARGQFRSLLGQYFAIDQIGDRLIRRWKPQISPAQYAAYQKALPGFLIGTYADRLYDYSDAKIVVQRAVASGNGAAVVSQVARPGKSPVTAIWTVEKVGSGYKISNLSVAGINLVLTQTADFDSFVQKNGFDKLVTFMQSRSS